MARSLRVRLQVWYGVVLVLVIAGFAGITYYRARAALFEGVDADLEAAVQYVDVVLRRFPPMELRSADAVPRKPPPWEKKEKKGPPGKPPPPPPEREGLLEELALPGRSGRFYFGVWRADGSVLKAVDLPEGLAPPEAATLTPHEPLLMQRGENREVAMPGPPGSRILVGRSVRREQAELNAFAWRLGGAGAIVLGIGLAGGWLASARILRPVAAISKTASTISATNMSERIDAAAVDQELTELAKVLNATFDRLQAAFERQARFTADASHELRTPLAILRSNAELALARMRTPQEYRSALTACVQAADRMTTLVEGLLTLARADVGKLRQVDKVLDLRGPIEDALEQVRPLALDKQITLSSDLQSVQVKGDPLRLGQLMTNLVNNAVQHNRAAGSVHVGLNADGGMARIAVRDDGPGIPLADQPHIFDRFFRVDKARARASGGVGLGLAICKTIVEAHGGMISFESQPGSGTTFSVQLPLPHNGTGEPQSRAP